jgi:hypothetical protein
MPAPYVAPVENGIQTAAIAGGVTGDTTIKTGSGYLGRVLVTSTNGAAAINIYDGTTATGTIIGVIAASAAVGTVATFGMPCAFGITVKGAATNGALTVSYY